MLYHRVGLGSFGFLGYSWKSGSHFDDWNLALYNLLNIKYPASAGAG